MKKKVLLETEIHQAAIELLAGEVDVLGPPLEAAQAPLDPLPGCHGLITSSNPQITGEVMDGAPLLEVIGRPGVGLDNIDLDAATECGIAVVFTPDAPTESTAEHAVAFILTLAKRIREADISLRQEGFERRHELVGTELKGKRLGVVGLGRIGSRVAEICGGALKMEVLAYDPYVDEDHVGKLGVQLRKELHHLLGEADFISLHTPLTPETRGMIGATELQAMKGTAYLINTSRGPVVDEDALASALRTGQIAGAALDVFSVEPPSPSNPLLTMDNVVTTPHIGSATEDGLRKMGVGVAEEVLMVLRGERPHNLANPNVWKVRK